MRVVVPQETLPDTPAHTPRQNYILVLLQRTAGLRLFSYMDLSEFKLVCCYLSLADISTRERIWLHVRAVGGWMSYHPLGTLFYVQRELTSPLLLIDPLIERKQDLDYLL